MNHGVYHVSLDPKDYFDAIEGEPLRDFLGQLQNANARSAQQRSQQATNSKLDQIAHLLIQQQLQQEQLASLPPCPYCNGRLEGTPELCKHCRSTLSWVEGYPCKPGMEGKLKSKIDEARRDLEQQQARELERTKAQHAAKLIEDSEFRRLNYYFLCSCVVIIAFLTVIISSSSSRVQTKESQTAQPSLYKELDDQIFVDEITEIPIDLAKELSQSPKNITFVKVTKINSEVAKELSLHKGTIWLEQLSDIDSESYRHIKNALGEIHIPLRIKKAEELKEEATAQAEANAKKNSETSKVNNEIAKGNQRFNMSQEPLITKADMVRDSIYEEKKIYIQKIFGDSWPKPIKYPEPLKPVTIRATKKERLIPYYIGMRNRNINDLIEARASGKTLDSSLKSYILNRDHAENWSFIFATTCYTA